MLNYYRMILTIQFKFKRHLTLTNRRRRVLKSFWMTEFSQILKENPKTKARKTYIDKVALIKNEIRDIVIEKWMNYVKSENLSEFMLWRLSMLQMNLSRAEMKAIMNFMEAEN